MGALPGGRFVHLLIMLGPRACLAVKVTSAWTVGGRSVTDVSDGSAASLKRRYTCTRLHSHRSKYLSVTLWRLSTDVCGLARTGCRKPKG